MATFNEDIVSGGRGFGGMGFGGGEGGLGGGLLLGLLLGRGNLFGGGQYDGSNHGNCVTNESLNQQTLGDIKAAIPLAEAQVQLAMAGLQSNLSAQATADTQYLSAQNQNLALAQAAIAASLARDIGNVDTNVDRQSAQIQETIYRDGEATRALITSNRIADLEQQLTVAQLRESEQRGINREIVNTNTITIQMQQQQQQQQLQMQNLAHYLNALTGQVAKATNSNVIVGSAGTTTGAQTASPTNVVA